MKRLTKAALPISCAVLLLLPLSSSPLRAVLFTHPTDAGRGESHLVASHASAASAGALPYKEYNFYYNGTKWISGWFHCDAGQEVEIFSKVTSSKTLRYKEFLKQHPSQKTLLKLHQQGDADCATQKCWYTLSGAGRSFLVEEMHYLDEEAYWTNNHKVKHSLSQTAPERDCRWFFRTRLAITTERRTIYVSENDSNVLEYRSYNYQGASDQPSLLIGSGVRTLDAIHGIETFTFQTGQYAYILKVSTVENRPMINVLVKKNGAQIQQEHCLSYTYLKKS